MTLLGCTWTVQPGVYVRAVLASFPVLVALPLLAGVLVAVVEHDEGLVVDPVLFAVPAVVALVVVVVVLRRQLRRLEAAARSGVQEYDLATDELRVVIGRDRQALPLAELSVARVGPDRVGLRRRGRGRRPLLVFFDDPGLVPQAVAIIAERGATVHRWPRPGLEP